VVRSWFGVKEQTTEGTAMDQKNVEDEASLSRSAAFVNCHVQASLALERKFGSCDFGSGLALEAHQGTQVTRLHAIFSIFDEIVVFFVHVQAEVDKGVDPSRIFLVGFGQGGATVSDEIPSIQYPILFLMSSVLI
jgi:hypothetical protein